MWCGAQLCPTLYDPMNCSPPLSVEFYRQGFWSGLPFPNPGDLPHSGIEPMSLVSLALAGGFFTISATWEALNCKWVVSESELNDEPLCWKLQRSHKEGQLSMEGAEELMDLGNFQKTFPSRKRGSHYNKFKWIKELNLKKWDHTSSS